MPRDESAAEREAEDVEESENHSSARARRAAICASIAAIGLPGARAGADAGERMLAGSSRGSAALTLPQEASRGAAATGASALVVSDATAAGDTSVTAAAVGDAATASLCHTGSSIKVQVEAPSLPLVPESATLAAGCRCCTPAR